MSKHNNIENWRNHQADNNNYNKQNIIVGILLVFFFIVSTGIGYGMHKVYVGGLKPMVERVWYGPEGKKDEN